MAPAYKMTYFDVHGLGEPIKFLFAYGGIEFEDIRFDREEWVALKPKMPFGQAPIIEHKGKVAHQTLAIGRYLAKQVKLYGSDDWEDLEIDATVDTITDFRQKGQQYFYEPDAARKESLKAPLMNDTIPFYLKKFDDQVNSNKGYFIGGKLTWADLHFVGLLEYLDLVFGKDTIAGYSNLKALKDKVLALPKIKTYLAQRKAYSLA